MTNFLKATVVAQLAATCLFGAITAPEANAGYRYTPEEAKLQFSYFYNLGRSLGPGHMDTALSAERQLASHGFPPVGARFVKTVRECYEATGDAYCWDR